MMHDLFPTSIYKSNRKVTNKEKNRWCGIVLDNLDENGFTQDFLGFYQIHHRKEIEGIYAWIISEVRKYLEEFAVDHSNIDLHITKSFINLTRDAETPEHEHSENQITFTYYPHIAKGREQDLIVYHEHFTQPNEPYPYLFWQVAGEWNKRNSLSKSIPIEEGDLVIMPSKIRHSTSLVDQSIKKEYEDVGTNRENIKDSRICIAGDIMMTQKERCDNLWRVLSPVKDWRTFD